MTIKDIARKSGYAVSTVSRALNNHPDVSDETKQKIQEIVQQCGFVPNNNARQLKAQQSSGILIVVKGAFNLFFANILERMQTAIAAEGYTAEVHYLDEDDDELLAAQQLRRERKPLGFLFLGGNVQLFQQRFAAIDVPSVLATTVSRELDFPQLSCVGVDDAAAGADACNFLLQKGHRSIAVLGGRRELSYISALRYSGFSAAFAAATGAPHPPELYQKCSFSLESAYRAMQHLLERQQPFTAVFCMSDLIAIGAMRALHEAGLGVPGDVSVLGFDGIELARYCTPRLATICQPQQDIALHSVRQLLDAIERAAPAQTIVLPAQLVDGESVKAL